MSNHAEKLWPKLFIMLEIAMLGGYGGIKYALLLAKPCLISLASMKIINKTVEFDGNRRIRIKIKKMK